MGGGGGGGGGSGGGDLVVVFWTLLVQDGSQTVFTPPWRREHKHSYTETGQGGRSGGRMVHKPRGVTYKLPLSRPV